MTTGDSACSTVDGRVDDAVVYDADPLKLRLQIHIDDIKLGFVHDGACDSDHAACPY